MNKRKFISLLFLSVILYVTINNPQLISSLNSTTPDYDYLSYRQTQSYTPKSNLTNTPKEAKYSINDNKQKNTKTTINDFYARFTDNSYTPIKNMKVILEGVNHDNSLFKITMYTDNKGSIHIHNLDSKRLRVLNALHPDNYFDDTYIFNYSNYFFYSSDKDNTNSFNWNNYPKDKPFSFIVFKLPKATPTINQHFKIRNIEYDKEYVLRFDRSPPFERKNTNNGDLSVTLSRLYESKNITGIKLTLKPFNGGIATNNTPYPYIVNKPLSNSTIIRHYYFTDRALNMSSDYFFSSHFNKVFGHINININASLKNNSSIATFNYIVNPNNSKFLYSNLKHIDPSDYYCNNLFYDQYTTEQDNQDNLDCR